MTLEPQHLLENLNKMRGRNDENFHAAFESLEIETEKEIQECLASLGMEALKKTNRKSLPYKEELFYTAYISSFINDILLTSPLKRKLARELLNDNIFKIRFFVDINIPKNEQGNLDRLEYSVKYYVH
jgi:hypothetical protein